MLRNIVSIVYAREYGMCVGWKHNASDISMPILQCENYDKETILIEREQPYSLHKGNTEPTKNGHVF